jgi:hypothetical protein
MFVARYTFSALLFKNLTWSLKAKRLFIRPWGYWYYIISLITYYVDSSCSILLLLAVYFRSILHFDIKETTFAFGHFTILSGIFYANYMSIFHKSKVLTVILRCSTCLNLNWFKSYNLTHKFFCFHFFSILEE